MFGLRQGAMPQAAGRQCQAKGALRYVMGPVDLGTPRPTASPVGVRASALEASLKQKKGSQCWFRAILAAMGHGARSPHRAYGWTVWSVPAKGGADDGRHPGRLRAMRSVAPRDRCHESSVDLPRPCGGEGSWLLPQLLHARPCGVAGAQGTVLPGPRSLRMLTRVVDFREDHVSARV